MFSKKFHRKFWAKIKSASSGIGKATALKILTLYYCMLDKKTPLAIKISIIACIVYFINPLDAVSDFIVGLGYADDLSVIIGTMNLVDIYITDEHIRKAYQYVYKEKSENYSGIGFKTQNTQ